MTRACDIHDRLIYVCLCVGSVILKVRPVREVYVMVEQVRPFCARSLLPGIDGIAASHILK